MKRKIPNTSENRTLSWSIILVGISDKKGSSRSPTNSKRRVATSMARCRRSDIWWFRPDTTKLIRFGTQYVRPGFNDGDPQIVIIVWHC